MVYKKNFVVAVKSEGKVLREDNEKVYLPVGTEYSVLLKNMQNRKALVKVFIDGEDVLNGSGLIIDAHSEMELERFLGNDMDSGRRFKYIEKSKKISKNRGDKLEDGILCVEVQYEKEFNYIPWYPPYQPLTTWPNPYEKPIVTWEYNNTDSTTDNNFKYGYYSSKLNVESDNIIPQGFNLSDAVKSINVNNQQSVECDGITVKGSESKQQFAYGNIGVLEDKKYVICLQLKGIKPSGKQVQQPITVKDKIQCEVCGTKNKSNHKYCVECGAFLF